MRILGFVVLSAVAVTSVTSISGDCYPNFCLPIFIKEIRQFERKVDQRWQQWNWRFTRGMSLQKVEDEVWNIQRMMQGSIWDLLQGMKEFLSKIDGFSEREDAYILNPLIFNPQKPPFNLTQNVKDHVLNYFKPSNGGEPPMFRLVTDLVTVMNHLYMGVLYRPASRKLKHYEVISEVLDKEDRHKILESISNLMDCQPYFDHPGTSDLKGLANGFFSLVDDMEKTGNWTLEYLEAHNKFYQQLLRHSQRLFGPEAQKKVKNTVNTLLALQPGYLETLIRSVLESVEVAMDMGNEKHPGVAIYMGYFFDKLKNGEILQSEMKNYYTIRRYLLLWGKMLLDLVHETTLDDVVTKIVDFAEKFEDWSHDPQRFDLHHWTDFMENILPVPRCLKEKAPKIKFTGHNVSYPDLFLLRIVGILGYAFIGQPYFGL